MDGSNTLAGALGTPSLGYEPAPVGQNLWAMAMRTDRSLQEYLRIHLKVPVIPDIKQLSSVFDFVADAAPGVKEVLAVGKVCWEVKQGHYDVVIVDAEASGHVVAQISSPRTIHSLVPRGPLRDQTGWMLRILDDPGTCGVVIVSTPEELPVTESLDLASRLRAETRTDVAAFVINMAEPEVPAAALALAGGTWFASVAPSHAESVRLAQVVRESQVLASAPLLSAGVPAVLLPALAGTEPEVVRRLVPVVEAEVR